MPWPVLLQQLSHVRLRCGLCSLSHLSNKKSKAIVQQCISCGALSSDIWKHIFGECPRWEPRRNLVRQALGVHGGLRSWDLTYWILSVHPHSEAYAVCLNFMDEVVKAADAFWATSVY